MKTIVSLVGLLLSAFSALNAWEHGEHTTWELLAAEYSGVHTSRESTGLPVVFESLARFLNGESRVRVPSDKKHNHSLVRSLLYFQKLGFQDHLHDIAAFYPWVKKVATCLVLAVSGWQVVAGGLFTAQPYPAWLSRAPRVSGKRVPEQ